MSSEPAISGFFRGAKSQLESSWFRRESGFSWDGRCDCQHDQAPECRKRGILEAWGRKEGEVKRPEWAHLTTLTCEQPSRDSWSMLFEPALCLHRGFASYYHSLLLGNLENCKKESEISFKSRPQTTIPRFHWGKVMTVELLWNCYKFVAQICWEEISNFFCFHFSVCQPQILLFSKWSVNMQTSLGLEFLLKALWLFVCQSLNFSLWFLLHCKTKHWMPEVIEMCFYLPVLVSGVGTEKVPIEKIMHSAWFGKERR